MIPFQILSFKILAETVSLPKYLPLECAASCAKYALSNSFFEFLIIHKDYKLVLVAVDLAQASTCL